MTCSVTLSPRRHGDGNEPRSEGVTASLSGPAPPRRGLAESACHLPLNVVQERRRRGGLRARSRSGGLVARARLLARITEWRGEGVPMMSLALTFLIVGLVAGLLGLWGIAAVASQIAWVLFLIGVVLLVLHMIGTRRLPPAV